MRQLIASFMQLLGIGSGVIAGFVIDPALGLAVLSVGLVVVGIAAERGH